MVETAPIVFAERVTQRTSQPSGSALPAFCPTCWAAVQTSGASCTQCGTRLLSNDRAPVEQWEICDIITRARKRRLGLVRSFSLVAMATGPKGQHVVARESF